MLKRLRRRPSRPERSSDGRLELLERRVAHLEELLQGLQDAVHRDAVRRDEETAQLQRRIAPGEMARALSEDARKRGIE